MFITDKINFYDQQELHQGHYQNSMQGNLHTSLWDVTLLPSPYSVFPYIHPTTHTSYSVHRNVSAGKHVKIMATETTMKWVTQGKRELQENPTLDKKRWHKFYYPQHPQDFFLWPHSTSA
jgi:hypothetical protein